MAKCNWYGEPQEEFTCPHCNDQFDDSGLCSCGRGPCNEQTSKRINKRGHKSYILEYRYTPESWEEYKKSRSLFVFGKNRTNVWRVEGRYRTEKALNDAYNDRMKRKLTPMKTWNNDWYKQYEYRRVLP